MQISISNIVFVGDNIKSDRDRLVAVFTASFTSDSGVLSVSDFRYYQPTDGEGYVTVPSVKTKRGTVHPVAVNPMLRRLLLLKFIEAWENLPKAPVPA